MEEEAKNGHLGRLAESATPFVRLEKSATPFEGKSMTPQGIIPGTVSLEAAIAAAAQLQAQGQAQNSSSTQSGAGSKGSKE